MLSRDEIVKFGPPGFAAGQKEKDYVQHCILAFLSREGFEGEFKGGTALQKAYGLPRYSEDLDFTLGGAPAPNFEGLEKFLSSSGFGMPECTREENEISLSAKIKVQGPLFNGFARSLCHVRMDFSKREKPLLPFSPILITPPYNDIIPYTSKVMAPEEISAEKARAVMTRVSARDLYDLYFLARMGRMPTLSLVDAKLAYYKKEFSFSEFEKSVGKLKSRWKVEIRAFAPQEVEYEAAKEKVLEAFKELKK